MRSSLRCQEDHDQTDLNDANYFLDYVFNGTSNLTEEEYDYYLDYHLQNWTECATVDDHPTDFIFAMNGVVLLIVAILGIVGNALAIAVLLRKNMQNLTTILLTGLAISDIVYLLTAFYHSLHYLDSTIKTEGNDFKPEWVYADRAVHVISNVAYTISSWIVVAVSIQRLLSVYCPYCVWKVKLTSAWKLVLIIYSAAFVFNFPRILYYILDCEDLHKESTKIFYKVYELVTGMARLVLPCGVLIVCYIMLLVNLRKQSAQRANMGARNQRYDERSTTGLVIAVITLFIVTLTPGVPLLFLFYKYNHNYIACRVDLSTWHQVAYFLVAINSACNFPLYCLLGHQGFRREIKEMLGEPSCGTRIRENLNEHNLLVQHNGSHEQGSGGTPLSHITQVKESENACSQL